MKSNTGRDIQHVVRITIAQWRFMKIKEGNAAISYVVFVPVSLEPPE